MNAKRIREYIDEWEAGHLTYNGLRALIYVECTNKPTQNADSQVFEDEHSIESVFNTLTQEQKELVYYLIGRAGDF